MDAVEKRKRTIINIVYVGIILGLLYLVLKYALWLFLPFIIAFFVAAILQKPVNFLAKKTPLKKGIWSGILVLLIAA
ncbi:MAG: sporulation integral membrane protein YtvI, partial [Clostridia bacterium]|nr:sporulation integral membrane protein YtvI [Clostridia bacterium]